FCDRIVLINLGRKILDGRVKDIQQEFKENIFKIELDNTNSSIPDGIEVLQQDESHLLFHLQENHTPNDVLAHYIRNNNSIHAFNEILPTLNEIFIRLVKETPTAREFH